MPSGEIHYAYFKKGYTVEIPISLILCLIDWKFALGNILGYSFHRYCDNDLDLMGTSSAEGRQVNEIPVFGHIMFGFSSMYGSAFRRFHRHWITHFPFVSTLIRLVCFFTIPFILFDYYGVNLIGNGWHLFHIGFWIGLSSADSIHWALDSFYGD